jgi:hypothetical protein
MKKLILSVVLALSFGFCFAPINMGRVPANKIKRELTDEERGKQQNNTPQIGEVGVVPEKDNEPTLPESTNDPAAQNTVATALKHASEAPKPSDRAKEDLAVATDNMKSSDSGGRNMLIWALIFAGLGFGIMFGVKRWADKVVPDVPKKKKVSW